MKRIVIWSSVAVLVVVSGLAIARASDARGWQGCFGHGWGHPGPMGYIAHELNLNDTQKTQIESMWKAEKPTVTGLLQKLSSESREMDAATAQGKVDESKVEEIASRQGATIAKLIVEKEHFKANVYKTVLTPQQRAKADEMLARWHDRIGHMGWAPGMQRHGWE